jgi:hypothetical protein
VRPNNSTHWLRNLHTDKGHLSFHAPLSKICDRARSLQRQRSSRCKSGHRPSPEGRCSHTRLGVRVTNLGQARVYTSSAAGRTLQVGPVQEGKQPCGP